MSDENKLYLHEQLKSFIYHLNVRDGRIQIIAVLANINICLYEDNVLL